MKGFLLDENLPAKIRVKPSLPIHSSKELLGESASDGELWEFARQKEFVIVTKDVDFSDRMLVQNPPPWVVHVRFGNMRREDFHKLLERVWSRVEALLAQNKLIRVYNDRLEAIK